MSDAWTRRLVLAGVMLAWLVYIGVRTIRDYSISPTDLLVPPAAYVLLWPRKGGKDESDGK